MPESAAPEAPTTDIDKVVERVLNQLDDAGSTKKGDLHKSDDGGAFSFYTHESQEDDRLVELVKAMRDGRLPEALPRNRLPEGYKPRANFRHLQDFLIKGMRNQQQFMQAYAPTMDMLTKAMKCSGDDLCKAVGIDSLHGESGGALILPEFAPEIMDERWENDLWRRCDRYTVAGNRMSFPRTKHTDRRNGGRHGGVQGEWVGETDSMTSSKPEFEMTTLQLKKLCVVVYVSNEMLEDASYTLSQYVTRAVRDELNFQTGKAVTQGIGGKEPLGYQKAPCKVVVPKVTDQTADTIWAENILAMWARRLSSSGANDSDYIWTYNQNCEPQFASFQLGSGGNGGLAYLPPGGLSGSQYATLMGRPTIPTEFNKSVGDEGDIALINLSKMLGIEKGGITEQQSMHVEFLRDMQCLKFTMRLDARPLYKAPIIPFETNGSDHQSPFILLQAR